MRHKTLTLAVAALLAFGASGVVAASISPSPSATTAAQSPADDASPVNYTVEVIDPHDQLTAQEVEKARQVAWANEEVRSYFEDGAAVHFEVWAPQPNENRTVVSVAPAESPDKSRVLANVHLDHPNGEQVTDVKEPRILNESSMRSVNLTDNGTFAVESDNQDEQVDGDETTKLGSGKSITFDVQVEDTDGTVVYIHTTSDNQTMVTEDGDTTLEPAE